MGLSELKKLESLLRTAGDEGNCESVSIVLSDKDCRGLRGVVPSSTKAAGDAEVCSVLGVLLSSRLGACCCCSKFESEGLRKPLAGLLPTRVPAFEGEYIKVPIEEPLLPVDNS
jgi:hypothetical protein